MSSPQRKHRETFGSLRKLPSERYQASYVGPDGMRHNTPSTFTTMTDARAFLRSVQDRIALSTREHPAGPVPHHTRRRRELGAMTHASDWAEMATAVWTYVERWGDHAVSNVLSALEGYVMTKTSSSCDDAPEALCDPWPSLSTSQRRDGRTRG